MAKRKAARRRRSAPAAAKRARRAAPARRAKRVARKTAKIAGPKTGAPRGRAKAAKAAKASKPLKARKPLGTAAKTKAAKKGARSTRPSAMGRVKTGAKPTIAGRAVKAPQKAPAKSARNAPAAPARKLLTPELARKKHVLDLGRDRRRVAEDDVISSTPPSSLGLDRSASAARSGRQELRERYENHTETSPTLTGGDVDADWESAYSVGDEAPGGDNPTPDQNVVDDIGAAVGVEYDDNEELEGADRIEERDRHRWEYDPASSDDFDER
jgi:hypothetical protein